MHIPLYSIIGGKENIFRKVLYVKFLTKDFYKDGRIRVLMWKQVISYSIAFQD